MTVRDLWDSMQPGQVVLTPDGALLMKVEGSHRNLDSVVNLRRGTLHDVCEYLLPSATVEGHELVNLLVLRGCYEIIPEVS